ncbi:hypothetical protein AKG98_1181 [Moritella sp. JT01]|uniref:hypothetical protein n=1 Tax=Moritella sp. JT01 TaxID=756698 RepID=UPI000794D5AE|nr:hypothetical protein [Moritella sp. JT01]KXO09581.1 hypothetical protein AKG98_1181 [Moritella sp. JT01]
MKKASKAEVTKTYIHPDHYTPITAASESCRFTVTFRETGEHSIKRIGEGAPMKGHDILAKTIKEGAISSAAAYKGSGNAAVREALIKKLKDAKLLGYAARWDNTDGITGIYTSLTGAERAAELAKKKTVLYKVASIDLNNLDLDDLKKKLFRNGESIAFTGDYDIHDMLTHCGGRPRTVLQGDRSIHCLSEEKKIIQAINNKILSLDIPRVKVFLDNDPEGYKKYTSAIKRKGISRTKMPGNHFFNDYLPIRHGAQVNYMDHMIANERDKIGQECLFIQPVAEPSFPLAAVTCGNWYIIENINQLNTFYTFIGAVIKESWREDGSREFTEIKGKDKKVKVMRRSANLRVDLRGNAYGITRRVPPGT